MPRIFISYRRDDSRAMAGRIYDRLVDAFGEENIFKDVDRIPPGSTFAEVLESELAKCNVLLIIIGRLWVNITDKAGQRRLENPEDFVRIEVEKGLNRDGLLVIPVLVDEAAVPNPADLPDSLDKIASLQVVQVRHDPDFHRDMNRLIDFLKVLQHQEASVQSREQAAARRHMRRTLAGVGVLAALIVIGVIVAIANGTIQIFPTPVSTLDARQRAMQIVLSYTAEAVAAQATPTPNASATIQAFLTGFIMETRTAQPSDPFLATASAIIANATYDESAAATNAIATFERQAAMTLVMTFTAEAIAAQASPTPNGMATVHAIMTEFIIETMTAHPIDPFEATASAIIARATVDTTLAATNAIATFDVRQTQTQAAIDAYNDTPTARPSETPIPTPIQTCAITIVQQFAAPGQWAQGITWDGQSLWLADLSGTIFNVSLLRKVLGTFRSPEVSPEGITWTGSSFWIFTTNASELYEFQIVGQNTETLQSVESPNQIIGGTSDDLAWDGQNLWYSDQYNLYYLNTSGSILNTLAFGTEISAMDWDGTHLWIAHNAFPSNASLNIVDMQGNPLATFPSPVFEVNSLAWGDGNLWAIGRDALGGEIQVYQLDVTCALQSITTS